MVSLSPPEVFGPYDLLEELGRGGQGIVYRALDRRSGTDVALKLLFELTGPDRTSAAGDRPRGRAHANLCNTLESGVLDGVGYVAMDLVQGVPWSHALAQDPRGSDALEVERRRRLVRRVLKVAHALHHAHDLGLVHGDLKPANLLVAAGDEPIVLDLGRRRDGRARAPEAGSLPYLAPEQIDASLGELGPWTDVWALGALLYESLSGRAPFERATDQACCHAILRDEVELDAAPWNDEPRALRAILERALAKTPRARYTTAQEFAADLERWLDGRPVQARRASRWTRMARWARRDPLLASSVGVSVVAVLAWSLLTAHGWSRWSSALERAQMESDLHALRYLEERADDLWPMLPARVPAMDAWLAEARAVLGRRALHEASAVDAPTGEVQAFLAGLEGLTRQLADVEQRRARALRIARDTPDAREAWERARAELARDARFAGLELVPQPGLIPLGPDPASHLQEFAHLSSGRPPARDPDSGALRLEPDTGLVFVLVPGGRLRAGGAQRDGLELAPFLVSKYELTQGQWLALEGVNPSLFRPEHGQDLGYEVTLAHPVCGVSWAKASLALRHHGLELPSEVQWEHAARAGTSSAWSCGDDPLALSAFANLADGARERLDSSLRSEAERRAAPAAPFEDGFPGLAPVGRFRPNPFGLHDVHGNVSELVRDTFGPLELPPRPGDGLRDGLLADVRLHRGGGFWDPPAHLRSDHRDTVSPESGMLLGVRPVFPLATDSSAQAPDRTEAR